MTTSGGTGATRTSTSRPVPSSSVATEASTVIGPPPPACRAETTARAPTCHRHRCSTRVGIVSFPPGLLHTPLALGSRAAERKAPAALQTVTSGADHVGDPARRQPRRVTSHVCGEHGVGRTQHGSEQGQAAHDKATKAYEEMVAQMDSMKKMTMTANEKKRRR